MILVTGHQGYIGSELVKLLNSYVGYDLADGEDIMDSQKLRRKLEGVEGVIHLAGVVGEKNCAVNPKKAYETNSVGTLNLVDLARRMGIKNLITVSTCSIYGSQGVYVHSKVLAEVATRAYGYMVVRLGSLYGGNSRSDSLPESLKREAETGKVTVYCPEDFRPLVHIKDVARALKFLLPHANAPHKFDVARENMTKEKLGKQIAEKHGAEIIFKKGESSSYKVEDEALKRFGFKYEWSIERWLK